MNWKLTALSLLTLNGLALGLGVWATQTEQGQQFTAEQLSRGLRFNISQRPLYYVRAGLDGESSWVNNGCYVVRTDQVEMVAKTLGAVSNEWLPYNLLQAAIYKSGAQFQLQPVQAKFCLSNLPPLYVQGDGNSPEMTTYDPDSWQKDRSWIPNGTVKAGTPCMHPENMVRLPNNHLVWNSQGIVGAAPCSPVEPPMGSGS